MGTVRWGLPVRPALLLLLTLLPAVPVGLDKADQSRDLQQADHHLCVFVL